MLLDDERYSEVWERVYSELGFKPSSAHRNHSMDGELPFYTDRHPLKVYDIEYMSDNQIENLSEIIRECLKDATEEDALIYALDWHHSAWLYNPRNLNEQKSTEGHYFPSFYPDGDYYFFIDENFRFGYLSHPWRNEVWIFGEPLLIQIDKVVNELCWREVFSNIR